MLPERQLLTYLDADHIHPCSGSPSLKYVQRSKTTCHDDMLVLNRTCDCYCCSWTLLTNHRLPFLWPAVWVCDGLRGCDVTGVRAFIIRWNIRPRLQCGIDCLPSACQRTLLYEVECSMHSHLHECKCDETACTWIVQCQYVMDQGHVNMTGLSAI